MAGLPALRARLLPVLFSLAAHALVLAALGLWRGADSPPAARVLDTRIEVSLAEPPPLPKHPEGGSTEEGEITFHTKLASASPNSVAGDPSGQAPRVVPLEGGAAPSPAGGRGARGGGKQGKGTGLLAATGRARRVVYVLDRSVSMGPADALAAARREVLDSLRLLPADACFQVIAYNDVAEPLRLGGRSGLLPAETAVFEQVAQLLGALSAAGASQHMLAMQQALALQPDLVYFVTDQADELTWNDVLLITRLNRGRAAIHILELTGRLPRPGRPLAQLAAANGGTYRCAAPRP